MNKTSKLGERSTQLEEKKKIVSSYQKIVGKDLNTTYHGWRGQFRQLCVRYPQLFSIP